jgi:hypothetical protein
MITKTFALNQFYYVLRNKNKKLCRPKLNFAKKPEQVNNEKSYKIVSKAIKLLVNEFYIKALLDNWLISMMTNMTYKYYKIGFFKAFFLCLYKST